MKPMRRNAFPKSIFATLSQVESYILVLQQGRNVAFLGYMNNIRNRAEEIVLSKVVYE